MKIVPTRRCQAAPGVLAFLPGCERRYPAKGYSLMELGVVIVVICILAAVLFYSINYNGELGDTKVIKAGRASLQGILNQGSGRMELAPHQLPRAAVEQAWRDTFNQRGSSNNRVVVTVKGAPGKITPDYATMMIDGKRGATYGLVNGSVEITALSGFRKFKAENGHIVRAGS